jgi:muramoyltetrapeptide carboxypeptidase
LHDHWEQHVKEGERTLTPDELLDDYFGGLPQPSMAGFSFGHIKDPLTLPYGVLAELDSERGMLTILESATVRR